MSTAGHRYTIAVLTCALASAAVLGSPSVHAQHASAGASGTARRAFERGVTSLQLGRHGEALLAFQESYQLRPAPVVLYNLGLALRGLGRYRDAIDAFQRYLAAPEQGADASRLTAIRDETSQMQRSLIRLSVTVRPAGATVSIDGRPQTLEQGLLLTDPGAHVIEIAANGFRQFRQERTWRAGSESTLDVQLEPSSDGRLVVTPSVPDALIRVDGAPAGTGRADQPVLPGSHRIEVRAPGYEPFARTVRVGSSATVRIDAVLVRSTGGGGVVAGVLIVGSLLAAGGIIAGVVVSNGLQAEPYNAAWANVEALTVR